GRTREALDINQGLARTAPLVPWIQAAQIDLLIANHRLDEAQDAAAHAGRMWPRDRLIWFSRFFLDAFNGRPDSALAMVANRAEWPLQTSPEEIALAGRFAHAMASRSRADADQVLAAYGKLAPRGQGYAEAAIRIASALDRPDEAMSFARGLYLQSVPRGPRGVLIPRIGYVYPQERGTTALFTPPADAMWASPAFLNLASDIGLVDYWRSTVAPDFCHETASAKLCEAWKIPISRGARDSV
ncbi:MAG: hypothetical protein ACREQ5_28795, partial [Candidatus Dormibacteria bacterium]